MDMAQIREGVHARKRPDSGYRMMMDDERGGQRSLFLPPSHPTKGNVHDLSLINQFMSWYIRLNHYVWTGMLTTYFVT